MRPAMPGSRTVPGRTIDQRVPAETDDLGAAGLGDGDLVEDVAQPVALGPAGVLAMVGGMTVVPARLGHQDGTAITPRDLGQDLAQRRSGGVRVVIDPDDIGEARRHEGVGRRELPLADPGDRVRGEEPDVGMVLFQNAAHGDGEAHRRLARHPAQHGIDRGFVDRAHPQRRVLARRFRDPPRMGHGIFGRIEVVQIPDHVHAGRLGGPDPGRGIVPPRQAIAGAGKAVLARDPVMLRHAITRQVPGRGQEVVTVPAQTAAFEPCEDRCHRKGPRTCGGRGRVGTTRRSQGASHRSSCLL